MIKTLSSCGLGWLTPDPVGHRGRTQNPIEDHLEHDGDSSGGVWDIPHGVVIHGLQDQYSASAGSRASSGLCPGQGPCGGT